jgi:CRP/FNR family cyclic AMP-dependent transcriptional regulator
MRTASQDVCLRMKREHGYFSFLGDEDFPDLAEYLECRQVEAGETLWSETDPGNDVAFIVEGRLEIKKATEFEGKEIVLGVLSAGAVAGELSFLDGSHRSVTAVALEPTSLLIIPRENFERLTQERPALGIKLLQGMLLAVSTRLRKTFERLAAIF